MMLDRLFPTVNKMNEFHFWTNNVKLFHSVFSNLLHLKASLYCLSTWWHTCLHCNGEISVENSSYVLHTNLKVVLNFHFQSLSPYKFNANEYGMHNKKTPIIQSSREKSPMYKLNCIRYSDLFTHWNDYQTEYQY